MPKPEPGERRRAILQSLAEMLENPKGEKITTASLAKKLDVSEAALYRHFASKAQMFEGLIEFIEETVFSLVTKIQADESLQNDGLKQVEAIIAMLLNFAQKNIGMTRVLIGDALVNEDDRLQVRMNQLHDRLEASIRQSARLAATAGQLHTSLDPTAYANTIMSFIVGRWHQFAKSGYRRTPTEMWAAQWAVFAG